MQLLRHGEDERETQERIAGPHSWDSDEAQGLWKASSPLLGGLVSSSCRSHPPPTPSQHSPGWNHVGPVRRLRGHILGSTAGKTRWKRAPLGSPRSPAAAARTTVVALRQPPGSYNWAYDLLQVGKPRKCNLKKRISHSDKNLLTRRVVGTLKQRSLCSLHFEWARAAQQQKLVEAAQQGDEIIPSALFKAQPIALTL